MTTPATPRLVGRRLRRVLVAALLAAIVLTALLVGTGHDLGVIAAIVAAGIGLLLAGLPAVLLLLYSWRAAPPEVPPPVRRAVYWSGGALLVGGAGLAFGAAAGGWTPGLVAGVIAALCGAVGVVRAATFHPPASAASRLTSGRVGVAGFVVFLVVALVVPKMGCGCGTKADAYRAAVRSDLRNLMMAEDQYFADHHRYGGLADVAFVPTEHDHVDVVAADTAGWRALARHDLLDDREMCGIWVGTPAPDGMHGALEGEPLCWRGDRDAP